jgi:hypothetical protein
VCSIELGTGLQGPIFHFTFFISHLPSTAKQMLPSSQPSSPPSRSPTVREGPVCSIEFGTGLRRADFPFHIFHFSFAIDCQPSGRALCQMKPKHPEPSLTVGLLLAAGFRPVR